MNSTTGPLSDRRPRSIRTFRAVFAGIAGTALLASGLFAVAPAYAAPVIGGSGEPVDLTAGRYIVTLVDDAAAVYDGGVSGYAPTRPGKGEQLDADAPAVEKYSKHLDSTQESVAKSVGATADYTYTLALNGFSAELTSDQAAKLRSDKRVRTLQKSETHHIDVAEPSTDFLGLSGDGGVWDQLGGIGEAGKGVVVGIIDTGIAPENPSFAGDALGTTPGDEPYLDGDTITYQKSDGSTFHGVCQPGENAAQQWDGTECSTKIVGARYFLEGFGAGETGTPDLGEYHSPRDGDGHGSHTGSTAVGNADVPTSVLGIDRGPITGVAPAAKISVYKVCWSGPDPDPFVTTDDGCNDSDSVAAIEQAVADGVDVLNFSIGSASGASSVVGATDIAFFNAAAAGIFVAASAGNSGPGATTLDHASPWYTTVAASTIPSYEATASFTDDDAGTPDAAYPGGSISISDDVTAPVVYAGDIGLTGAVNPQLCLPGTLDPAKAAGNIVVCDRGTNARLEKSTVAAAVGAVGAIIVNVATGSIDLDEHPIPTVHLQANYRDAVIALARTAGTEVTLSDGNSTGIVTPTPQVAGFSSRGPVVVGGGDVLKPDISAPGVGILAAAANAEGEDPTYEFLSGTSMASPHIAGIAALYLSAHPTASPAEVKSAMMTSATDTVDANGAPISDVFAQGAGNVDPPSMLQPGLLYLNGVEDWKSYIQGVGYDWPEAPGEPEVVAVDPSDLNLASIAIGGLVGTQTVTRTVTATEAGTYTASVEGVEGVDVTVSPSTLSVAKGDSATFTVTFTVNGAAYDEYATGYLSWKSSTTTVRSPLAVQPILISAPDSVSGTGTTGSVDVEVTPGYTGEIPLAASSLASAVKFADPADPASEHSGSGNPPDDVFYPLTIPADTAYLRVNLDAVDDTTDLDLFVYLLDANGDPVLGWQSASGSADESVGLFAPTAGEYLVQVNVYSAPSGAVWDLDSTVVAPGGPPLTVDPAVLSVQQGVAASYTASWAGLEPETDYLGVVNYADTGIATLVEISTGEDVPGAPVNTSPPTITGAPTVGSKLTADPGEWTVGGAESDALTFSYQWQRDGVDIPGATKANYKVKKADVGTDLTVVVTAAAEGLPSGVATSAAVSVLQTSTTALSLSRTIGFSWQNTTASVKVKAGSDPATGTAQLIVDGHNVGAPVTLKPNGTATIQVPRLGSGIHAVKVAYSGSEGVAPSVSPTRLLIIIF